MYEQQLNKGLLSLSAVRFIQLLVLDHLHQGNLGEVLLSLSILKRPWILHDQVDLFWFLLREGYMRWHEAYLLVSERVRRTLKHKAQGWGQFLLAGLLAGVLSVEVVPKTAALLSGTVLVSMSRAGSHLHSAATSKCNDIYLPDIGC